MGRRTSTAAAAIALIALVATACDSAADAEPKRCRSDGASSVCLRHDDGEVAVTGVGFAPGSDVRIDLDTGAGQLVPVAADGTFPAPGQQLGFLPGLTAETHRLEGTDHGGRPVAYTVRCGVDAARRPRCAL